MMGVRAIMGIAAGLLTKAKKQVVIGRLDPLQGTDPYADWEGIRDSIYERGQATGAKP